MMIKKSVLLSVIPGMLWSGLTWADPLHSVPDTVSVAPGGEAQYLIMAPADSTITAKDIRVDGLPEGASWTLTCTGKKQENCRSAAGADDLPIFMLKVQIPANRAAGNYPFSLQDNRDNTSAPARVNADVRETIHFTHPGVMLNATMLAQLHSHTQSGNAVWDKALSQAMSSRYGRKDYQPSPHASVDAGGAEADDLRNDAIAAYTQAMLWVITRDKAYAENALTIMNSWSGTLSTDFTGANRFNLAAWTGDVWPRAAEIIRYTYLDENGNPLWQQQDIDRFKTLLQQRYINFIQQGFFTSGQYGGNLINSQAAAFINIGVFNDDPAVFLAGVNKWRRMLPAYIYMRQDGDLPVPPAFWRNNYIDRAVLTGKSGYWYGQDLTAASIGEGGLSQETCRDLGHVLWGFSALANGSETARLQGFDLHKESTLGTPNTARLSAGIEFNISPLNSKPGSGNIPVPADLCQGKLVEGSSSGKGELLFNDIVTRRGLSLPQTAQYLQNNRPTQASYFMVWETLSHYLNP